jgi:hypothetical protein
MVFAQSSVVHGILLVEKIEQTVPLDFVFVCPGCVAPAKGSAPGLVFAKGEIGQLLIGHPTDPKHYHFGNGHVRQSQRCEGR